MGAIAAGSAALGDLRSDVAVWSALIRARTGFQSNVTVVAVFAVLATGALVMLGALAGSTAIVQIAPGLAPMQFNTALVFVLCACAVLTRKPNRRVSLGCAVLVVLVSAATLVEYALAPDLGLDDSQNAMVTRAIRWLRGHTR